jgi:hypothetical protein
MPAFAKTKSMRPWAVMAALKSAVRELHWVTSVWMKTKGPGDGGGLTSALITVAPREPRSSTVARPIPEEPPVVVVRTLILCKKWGYTCNDGDLSFEFGPCEV